MTETEDQINRNEELLALHKKRKEAEEAKRIFELLPQGSGSGLDADTVDGMHAKQIIRRASAWGVSTTTGGGGGGVTDHGALTGLGDDDHTQYYNAARHTKAVHDALGIDAATLETSTKAEVQDHTLDAAKITSGVLADARLPAEVLWTDLTRVVTGAIHFDRDPASPFTVAPASAKVLNLNADEVDGVHLPSTIASVLTDHTKAVHDALALSHDSLSDVSTGDHHPPTAYNVFKLADGYNSIVQGTWVWLVSSTYILNALFYNSTGSLNDELTYKFSNKADTIDLCIIGTTAPNRGIITVYIDGVSQGTIDWYSTGFVHNVVKVLSITTTTDGEHTLSLKITSKNAGSSGYYFSLQYLWLRD